VSALAVALPLALLYAYGLWRAPARRRGWAAPAWFAGLAVLAVATSNGLERAADRELSMHMVQHELLGLVAAPLLAAGAPVRLALAASGRTTRLRLARILHARVVVALTHPAAGALAFAGILLAVHVPAVYDLTLRSGAVHAGVHAALLWSALVLWMGLLGADPLPRRASATATIAALVGAMAAMAALGATLAAQQHVVYAPYARPGVDALADQRVAGGLMSVGGMVVLVPLLLALAWRALAAEERRATVREARGLPAEGAR
jgi:cytochrome c oxidase assembly factor CtaG